MLRSENPLFLGREGVSINDPSIKISTFGLLIKPFEMNAHLEEFSNYRK